MRRQYPFHLIEPKWQQFWEKEQTFRAWNPGEKIPQGHPFAQRHGLENKKADANSLPPKFYILDMFPYPSGAGLHVGHPEGYTATDILARYRRAKGFNVLHPMGWDAFGLPAEQYAIKTGQHPRKTTEENIANFKRQIKSLGFSYDWSREVDTTDPKYFKWTQWIFLKLYNSWFNPETNKAETMETLRFPPKQNMTEADKRAYRDSQRLAYVAEAPVNWCEELGTVLANEEVIDGKSDVGGFPVVRKPMRQWMLRITAYAERLLNDLEGIDWSHSLKEMQRNWLGRSEGAEIAFEVRHNTFDSKEREFFHDTHWLTVFTTRPDTLFGATYMVLAPEHKILSQITTPKQKEAVEDYKSFVSGKSDLERTELAKEKTGVFTGAYALNPVNGERIPIWIADYVLASYGTGAIMAVPAHDTRDYEFATKFNLPILQVVQPPNPKTDWRGFVDEGISVNSSGPEISITGLPTTEAKKKITDWLEAKSLGKKTINYKLRDWLFSRQRYWGEPFPIVWKRDQDGKLFHEAVPEHLLPVRPPNLDDYKPTSDGRPPLARATDWVKLANHVERETNTMPQWAGSCWYYLRYLDSQNSARPWNNLVEKYWMGTLEPRLPESNQEIDKEIKRVVDAAIFSPRHSRRTAIIGRVPKAVAAMAFQVSGLNIEDYFFRLDSYGVRHAFLQHKVEAFEKPRGQRALAAEDFYKLPAVYAAPDHIEDGGINQLGRRVLRFHKRINGIAIVAEEVLTGIKCLALQTMFVRETAGDELQPARDTAIGVSLSTADTDRSEEKFISKNSPVNQPTLGVDLYVGGTEHAVLHLLYARFWHKVLFDLGYVSTPEPFFKLVNQGLILGEMEFYIFRDKNGERVSAAGIVDIEDAAETLVGKEKVTGAKVVAHKIDASEVEKRGAFFCWKNPDLDIRVDFRCFKMSKSRGNVVNPDDVMGEYGADAFRLYEMFMGPLEMVKPWNTKGVEGVYRFLGRVWRLFVDEKSETEFEQAESTTEAQTHRELLEKIQLSAAIKDVPASPSQLKALHACIKKVTEDLDALRFNTAISALMVFVNDAISWETKPVSGLRDFLILLAPFAPHLSEEVWQKLQNPRHPQSVSLSYHPWPEFDPAVLIEDTLEIPVQVNGKLRDRLRVAAGATREQLEAASLASEKIKFFLEGKAVKKIVIVPMRLVNIVLE